MAYQAVDPRTRGEARPFWHHPGKAGVVFRPISAPTLSTQGRYNQDELDYIDDPQRCKVNLVYLDFLCGFLSLVALFLTIPGLVSEWNIDNSLRWPMWQENVLCYNATFNASLLRYESVHLLLAHAPTLQAQQTNAFQCFDGLSEEQVGAFHAEYLKGEAEDAEAEEADAKTAGGDAAHLAPRCRATCAARSAVSCRCR